MSDIFDRLKAALADRYTIEHELGAGGMAIVYLATDLKLDRQVAIKVLRPELAAAIGIDRFVREVELTSQLEHPNILSIFDAGEADGFLYYVMPVVEGESLRDRLDRDTQLPLDDAIQITKEIAEALGHSHSKGIMHRDIKPENILLSGGHAVVADFGIARAVTMAGGEKLTQTGMAMGTPAYMSPEQASGTGHVDHRTDIYALGCVLYEMLAGEAPYTGPTAQAIIAKRFSDPVPSVRRVRKAVPEDIDAAIEKALDTTPADRFDSTEQFIEALTGERPVRTAARRAGDARWKRWAAAGVAAALVAAIGLGLTLGRPGGVPTAEFIGPNSIVVLPFMNISSDPAQEVMATGIAAELANMLTQIPELTVISRRTAFSYKGRDDLSTAEIAAQLRVAYVLEGTVRQVGNTIRITTELIDPRSDANLSSGNYSGTLEDIFAMLDSLAATVISEVTGTLLGERPTLWETDPEAYALFLQARHISDQDVTSQESNETAVSMFERVLEIAPDYAPAYGQLAASYSTQAQFVWRPPEEAFQMAVDAAERGLALDPDLVYARVMLGWIRVLQGDLAGAARHLEQAREMDPTHQDLLLNEALLLMSLGRYDEAIAVNEYVRDRDPLYLVNHGNLAAAYYWAGRWEDAAAASRTILSLNPSHGGAHGVLADALVELGEYDEALAEAELVTDQAWRLQIRAMANYSLGRQPEFENAMQELLEEWGDSPASIAQVYLHMGDVDATFEWLERWTPQAALAALNSSPVFAILHDDPRWAAWMDRADPSVEDIAAISFEVRLPSTRK